MTPAEAAAAELGLVYGSTVHDWHQPEGWTTPTTALMAAERGVRRLEVVRVPDQEPIPGIDDGAEVA